MNVILYTTDCPKCKILKKKLNEKGVLFIENHSVDEMLSLGIEQVPVLDVNGNRMDFVASIKWVNDMEVVE